MHTVGIEVVSDEDLDRKKDVHRESLEFYKSMKDIIDKIEIKSNLPAKQIQTDVMMLTHNFQFKFNRMHASTQTEEAYFPYDDDVRERINCILGNKLAKSSDKVLNSYQSFLN